MEASDSFYEFDTVKSTFSDRNQVSAQANIFQSNNREDSLKFGDLGLYNEESIDLEQYLHLGNTPPNINGDELLKQFGAYSSSPPVTVSIKPQTINASGISQGLAAFSLAGSNPQPQEPSVVQTTLSSSATTTQLGFQIKQEIEEHSVPEFYQDSEMPPGEEQPFQMAQGEQSNLGGQQVYITLKSLTPGQNVTTTSTADEPYNQAYNSSPEQGGQDSSDSGSVGKKRHRSSVNKESEEYKTKRFRNNLAVRKSREKSKARNKDLQSKVQSLQGENDKLNKKVELLTKELTVLRSLFTTVKPNNTSQ